jgi:flagellar basal body rod protein FlgG
VINGLHTSGLGAFGQSRRLDIIANNLANVGTPGFRRDWITFQERLVEALEPPLDFGFYNAYVDRTGGAPFIGGHQIDRSEGPLSQTDRPLDFAIEGDGFFGVRHPVNQELFFTRAGNFLIDAEGRLVTADGRYFVTDVSAQPVQIQAEGVVEIKVGRDGRIWLLGPGGAVDPVAQIGVFAVPFDQLVKHGDTLLRKVGAAPEVAVEAPGIRQGFLELSSVNPLDEMAELIQTTRLVESNLQMVRFQDATLDRVINTLGRL